jgi:hypothetical protein
MQESQAHCFGCAARPLTNGRMDAVGERFVDARRSLEDSECPTATVPQRGAVDAVRCERLWVPADLPELLSANAPQRG